MAPRIVRDRRRPVRRDGPIGQGVPILKISIFGLGYVGGTTMACLAELGHEILGVDINADKVATVNEGRSPVFEPGVSDLLAKHRQRGAVHATTDARQAVAGSEACLVCVGTPSKPTGELDDRHLVKVVGQIADVRQRIGQPKPILVRSTALPEHHQRLMELIRRRLGGSQPLAYAVHPEFLRAGQAVRDFMNPPKIIFGCSDEVAVKACDRLYPGIDIPATHTDPMTAALVKYADNCFHAVKVTFANEIGMLAKICGVDSRELMNLFCMDTKLNLSDKYLRPGLAFGGSCLPKDLRAAVAKAKLDMMALPMLEHVLTSNQFQVARLIDRVLDGPVRSVGLFGLAFKQGTDDVREAPLVTIAETLYGKGKTVRVYDPALLVTRMIGSNLNYAMSALPHLARMLVTDAAALVGDSDVVIVSRDFPEIDWAALPWRDDQRVFDLFGGDSLSGIKARIEGLYW